MPSFRLKYSVTVTTDTGAVSKIDFTTRAVMMPKVNEWLKEGWKIEIKILKRN